MSDRSEHIERDTGRMTTREARVAEALRDFVDHLDVPAESSSPRRISDADADGEFAALRLVGGSEAGRSSGVGRARRSVVLAIAASMALVAVAVFGIPRVAPVPATVPPIDTAITLPTELRSYEVFNTRLERSPVGRALMVYVDSGDDDWFFDRRQTIVLGSDTTSYRSLGIAEDRNRLGSSAPVEISPDGSLLAVGSPAWGSDVVVIESATGQEKAIHVTDAQYRELDPLTWSPDGRVLYVLDRPSTGGWPQDPGQLTRIEVDTGDVRPLPGLSDVLTASSSDDPSKLLVARAKTVDIVDAGTGRVLETLPGIDPGHLATNAWSPDGTSILLFADEDRRTREAVSATLLTRASGEREWQTRSFGNLSWAPGVDFDWQGGAWHIEDSYLVSRNDGSIVEFDLTNGGWSTVSRIEPPTFWHNPQPTRDRQFARELVRHLVLTRTPMQLDP